MGQEPADNRDVVISHPDSALNDTVAIHAREARAASKITLVVILVIMIAKGLAGIFLHSIALTTEALHTLLDLVTALLAWFTIRAAQAPPDADHPYGHGKIENLMALVQAMAIMGPALFIGYYSYTHLMSGDYHFVVAEAGLGLWTMGLTMVANLGLMIYLGGVAKRTGSPSIAANATHERVDFTSSVFVFAGILMIVITKQAWWDAALGLATAAYILWEGGVLLFDAAQVLLDRAAPPSFQNRIHAVLQRHGRIVHAYSNVRTRMHGQEVHADVEIQLNPDLPLSEVDFLRHHLEEELTSAIPQIHVHLQAVPCPADCALCVEDPMHLRDLVDEHTEVKEELKRVEQELLQGLPPHG
ncbi:MAG: cation diffusion facilitator family transporter [bacterium]